jgi:hypothetical protein
MDGGGKPGAPYWPRPRAVKDRVREKSGSGRMPESFHPGPHFPKRRLGSEMPTLEYAWTIADRDPGRAASYLEDRARETGAYGPSMKPLALILMTALALPAMAEEGWVELFNGKNLDGWTQRNGTAGYKVEGDSIVGTTAEGSPNSFLCTEKDYGDFEMTFEVKVDDALNSGVQIRSQTQGGPTGRVNGPQVEIEASGKNGAEAGYIYGEASGGWMTPKDKLKPHKHFKDGEWNAFRVVAKGPRIQVWINGEMISDLVDEAKFKSHPKGFIGLQVHSIGKGQGPFQVAWRKLKLKEL